MRYAELRPDGLAEAIRRRPVAIWPIGALEWHGPHLPLGLDGIVAEAFAERLQAQAGGLILPTLWHPITTLPHPASLDVRTETFRQIVRATAEGLAGAGLRVLCIPTGHYAQGHSLECFQLAEELEETIAVIAASPLEPLEDDALLDHAGRWETAQLAFLRPDLIDLASLPETMRAKEHAVLGEDPRLGRAEEAEAKWNEALAIWARWIEIALGGEIIELQTFYARRRERYREYRDTYYRGSWEDAIAEWWKTKD